MIEELCPVVEYRQGAVSHTTPDGVNRFDDRLLTLLLDPGVQQRGSGVIGSLRHPPSVAAVSVSAGAGRVLAASDVRPSNNGPTRLASPSPASWPATPVPPGRATPPTFVSTSPGAPRSDSTFLRPPGSHRVVGPRHGGLGPCPEPPSASGFHHRRLLPIRCHRRRHRALAGGVRPTAQDRHRVDHARPRSHGAGRLHRPGCRRRRGRPRPGRACSACSGCGCRKRSTLTSRLVD